MEMPLNRQNIQENLQNVKVPKSRANPVQRGLDFV